MTRLNRQYHETSDRLETLLKSTTGKNLLIPSTKGKTPVKGLTHTVETYGWTEWDAWRYSSSFTGVLCHTLFVVDIDLDESGRSRDDLLLDMYDRLGIDRNTPLSTSSSGFHLWFLRSSLCDENGLFTATKKHLTDEYFDIKTSHGNGNRSLVVCPPSPRREWIKPPWDFPLRPVPDTFIHYIIDNKKNKKKEPQTGTVSPSVATIKSKEIKPTRYEKRKMPDMGDLDIKDFINNLLVEKNHIPMCFTIGEYNRITLTLLPSHTERVCPLGKTHSHQNCQLEFDEGGSIYYLCHGEDCKDTKIPYGRWLKDNYIMLDDENDETTKRRHTPYLCQAVEPTIDYTNNPEIDFESYDERFVKPIAKYLEKYKSLVLGSAMGTGKTYVIRKVIDKMKPKSVLIMSPRYIFAVAMSGDYIGCLPDIKLYKGKGVKNTDPFKVCQMESLYSKTMECYDLVIIDESESNLSQFFSSTMKSTLPRNIIRFQTILRNAKNIIFADAFITDKTIKTALYFAEGQKIKYIKNTHQPYHRKAYCCGKNKQGRNVMVKTLGELSKTKKIVGVISSPRNVKLLETNLMGNTFTLTGDSGAEIKKQVFNIEKCLDDKDHFIYTSALTVGVNYDTKKIEKQFDILGIYSSCLGCCVRDTFQSSLRARTIVDNDLYFAYWNLPISRDPEKFPIFDRPTLLEIINARVEYHTNRGCIPVSVYGVYDYLHNAPDWVKELWVIHQQEQNISYYYHEDMLFYYLNCCGYTIIEDAEEEMKRRYGDNCIPVVGICLDNIKSITSEEFDIISTRRENQEATTDEIMEWDKYFFLEKVIHPTNNDGLYWIKYHSNSSSIVSHLWNVRYELGNYNLQDEGIFMGNKRERIEWLKKICEQLELKNTHDCKTIDRKILLKCVDYLVEERETIMKVFGLRLQNEGDHTQTVRRGVELLNHIWKSWGFSEFSMKKRKRQKTGGNVYEISNFQLVIPETNKIFYHLRI